MEAEHIASPWLCMSQTEAWSDREKSSLCEVMGAPTIDNHTAQPCNKQRSMYPYTIPTLFGGFDLRCSRGVKKQFYHFLASFSQASDTKG